MNTNKLKNTYTCTPSFRQKITVLLLFLSLCFTFAVYKLTNTIDYNKQSSANATVTSILTLSLYRITFTDEKTTQTFSALLNTPGTSLLDVGDTLDVFYNNDDPVNTVTPVQPVQNMYVLFVSGFLSITVILMLMYLFFLYIGKIEC